MLLATPLQRRFHESNPTTQTKAIVSREMQIAVHLHTGRGIWSRTWVGSWLFRHVAVLPCHLPQQNMAHGGPAKKQYNTPPRSATRCPTLYTLCCQVIS